ncbi:uncharacterized protein TNCV_493501 [Trichonephila clavipes]|nr:uncharacterized protein TNCV_493501 [Trichonephila clavipes]
MDEELKEILSSHNSSLKLEKVPILGSNFDIFCNCFAKKKRPYIPEAFRRIVFNNIHNLAHPGIRITTKLLTSKFITSHNIATPAELLYGKSIGLPCDFFEDTLFQPQSEFFQTLKATIKPVPFSYHSKQKPFIFKDLKDCSHVFVRTDSVRRSLQPPYHGPYKVINRSDKVFTLFIKGKNVNVSIDKLKPCFSDNSSESDIESSIGEDSPNKPAEMLVKKIRLSPLPFPTSTRLTRGGRQNRLPVHYHSVNKQHPLADCKKKQLQCVCVTITPREVVYGVEKLKDDSPLVLFIVLSQNMATTSQREMKNNSFSHLETTTEINWDKSQFALSVHYGLIHDEDLNKAYEKLWQVEEPIVKNKERLICEEHYVNTHFRTKEGKYVVPMPLKEEPACLVKVCLDSSYTKRDVLSTIAKIFDPIGLMAPVISKAKIFLQHLRRSKLEWNDLLPAEEYQEWHQFLVSLENINNIEISRGILVAFPEAIEIHGFTDASERCYGAAVYCKSKNLKSETLVRLITNKSRVAPIKSLTIPRL